MSRRWMVALVVLVLALAGVAAATRDDDPRRAAAGQPTTSTVPPWSTTTTTAPPATTTTTTAEAAATATTARPTTTTARATATTTAAEATPAAAAEATPTTVSLPSRTTVPRPPLCTADQIAVAAAPEQPSYAPGQSIFVTGTLRNRSAATCSYDDFTFEVAFRHASGEPLHRTPPVAITRVVPAPLAPGEAIPLPGHWAYTAQPAGRYAVTATWLNFAGNRFDATTEVLLT